MKTIIFKILSILILITSIISCSDDRLDEEFNDPNRITEENIPFLFTGALEQRQLFRPDYAPHFHVYRQLNKVTGIGGYPFLWPFDEWIVIQDWSGPSFHYQLFRLSGLEFTNNLNKIRSIHGGMSEEEKERHNVYIHLSKIVRSFVYQRTTDAYDDVPFLEAGQGQEGIFFPKFDSQQTIYNTILQDLKDAVEALKVISIPSDIQQTLNSQDIINNGDISLWIKFANSLRLRMAMRLSIVDPAKAQEVLNELNSEELVTEATDLIGIAEVDKVLLTTGGDGRTFPRAFQERGWDMWAPRLILDEIFNYKQVQDFTVDPRTYVVFQPASDGRYIGMPHYNQADSKVYLEQFLSESDAEDFVNFNHFPSNSAWAADQQLLSKYNRVTYLNDKNKWPSFTPSETHLLLAEAAVRFPGSVSASAEDSYQKAIELSIDWYYEQNTTNTLTEGSTPPLQHVNPDYYATKDQAHIDAYLPAKRVSFQTLSDNDKIEEIFYQKLAHLNIYDPMELWSEARRLMKDHGLLLDPVDDKVEWLERLLYAPEEARDNPNYSEVAGQDNTTTPVWWTGRK